jgi:hypothetical protein
LKATLLVLNANADLCCYENAVEALTDPPR